MRDDTAYRVCWVAGRRNGGLLGYPAKDEDLRRLLKGDRGFAYDEKTAAPGEVVTDLPAISVKALVARGQIIAEADADALAEAYMAALGLEPRRPKRSSSSTAKPAGSSTAKPKRKEATPTDSSAAAPSAGGDA